MSNNKSFTLIELLVVIAIIGVLSAIIITSMSGAVTRSKITRLQVFSDTIRAQLSDSLVSWWSFNEGTGTTAYDKWEGNDGTLTNLDFDSTDGWKSGGNCVSGNCLEFDGDNDYVDCESDSSIDSITVDLTLEAWVMQPVLGGDQNIISTHQDRNDVTRPYDLENRGNARPCFIMGNGVAQLMACAPINSYNANKWAHIIGSIEGTNMKIYVNGVLKDTETFTGNRVTGARVIIGSEYSAGGRLWDGLIDEIRIYNSAATISQIQSQYLAGLDKLLSNGVISKSEYNQRINKLSKNIK